MPEIDLADDTYQDRIIHYHSPAGQRERWWRNLNRKRHKKFVLFGLVYGGVGGGLFAWFLWYLIWGWR